MVYDRPMKLWVLLLVAACSSSDDAPAPIERPPGVSLCYSDASASHPAAIAFTEALAAGDRSARSTVIDMLTQATTDLPDEEQLHLYLGLAHLWRLAEPLDGEGTPAAQLPSATATRDELTRASNLCPTDYRIAAWLGPMLVRFGRILNDPSMIDQGLAILDDGIAHDPSFVLFSKMLVYADFPADAPEFQSALSAVLANGDACDATPNDPACTNATVSHNREGAGLFLGDILAKAGLHDEAYAAYSDAMAGDDFATWGFGTDLSSRLTTLDARIAAQSNDDPADDPAVAWTATTQCAYCHTR